MRRTLLAVLIVLGCFTFAPSASAQQPVLSGGKGTPLKNFPIYPVGARPLGMGGAFIALADDVSATYWNPAGLAYLPRPELTLQGMFIDYEFERPFSGSYQTDLGTGATTNNLEYRTYSESKVAPSLVGFVYPNRILPFGISIARTVDYTEEWTSENIQLTGAPFRPLVVEGEVAATNVNFSFARSLSPTWNLGINLKYTFFEFRTSGVQFSDQATFVWDLESSGGGFSFDIGTIVEVSPSVSLGMVFRWGEQINYDERFFNSTEMPVFEELKEFPSKLGLGVTWFIIPELTLNGDVYYVRNSRLAEHINLPAYTDGEDRLELSDGIEAHVGVEWVYNFGDVHNIALRGGAYYEPSYFVTYERSDSLEPEDVSFEDQLEILFPEGDDLFHITAGFGYGVEMGRGHSLGFDIAVNFADEISQYIFAIQYYIGGS